MIYKILFALCVVLEIVFVPIFLKAAYPERCTKSLIYKTVCATLFVSAGVLACVIAGNKSTYAKYILIGLALCWVGDFLLHCKKGMYKFVIGGVAFLFGHVFYIKAYCSAISKFFPDAKFFDVREIIAFAVIIIVGFVALIALGLKFKPIYLAASPYIAMLALMLTKAASLGIRAVAAGIDNAAVMCALLISGAFLFTVSDTVLALNSLREPRTPYSFKIVCITTYFTAQLLLASTCFVIFA